jgi:Uma2 family endonuclease
MEAFLLDDTEVRIPAWVNDLASFRRWARSDEYPGEGRFAYLAGRLWVDMSKEQLYSHNAVKTRVTVALTNLNDALGLGEVFSDGVRLSNVDAELSTNPDFVFVSFESLRSGRVELTPGSDRGFVELVGSPDLVVEVVSDDSVRKDRVTLRDLYRRAGIREYWIIDARGGMPALDILRRSADGWVLSAMTENGMRSDVFSRSFRLTQGVNPLGHPTFTLLVAE